MTTLAASHATNICFPSGRIAFLRPKGARSENGPLQGQALFYFGSASAKFIEVFGEFGATAQFARDAKRSPT